MVDYECVACEWAESDVEYHGFYYYCPDCGERVVCHIEAEDLAPEDTLSDKV